MRCLELRLTITQKKDLTMVCQQYALCATQFFEQKFQLTCILVVAISLSANNLIDMHRAHQMKIN